MNVRRGRRAGTLVLAAVASFLAHAGCAATKPAATTPPTDATPPGASASAPAPPTSALVSARPLIVARDDRFELVDASGTRPIFFRGVNLGAAPPGRFPGEFAISKDDYRRWLRFARSLHANSIRVYALHPPAFYEALREENDAHPGRPLWLFQEVWTELPESNDFWDQDYTRRFDDDVKSAVDALHGNATIPERPGHASGRYATDVSMYLAGWMLGREWEPFAVRETEARRPDSTRYEGRLLALDRGTAMESWLARICDLAATYERDRYGLARMVSFVNWPTLDPMRHPTETERGGAEAEHDEDAYSVDPSRIHALRAPGTETKFLGYFANYHVYPYYPDFMNLDPGYGAFQDRHGRCSYAGYLRDLKAHTRGIPLLIGEFGVPSSRRAVHLQPQGIDHGGASETVQGEQDVRLLEDIEDAGGAGAHLFALFDEWFKVNWLVESVERPRDRDPFWHNLLDPEENYGLLSFDSPPRILADGNPQDWAGIPAYASVADTGSGAHAGGGSAPDPGPLRALYATSDSTRFYLRLDVTPGTKAMGDWTVGVSLDVLDPERGDKRLPNPIRARWSRGAELALVVETPAPAFKTPGGASRPPRPGRAELFVDASTRWSTYARFQDGERFAINRSPFRPVANDDGRYAPILIETNRERVARDGTFYPARHRDWGRLAGGSGPDAEWGWNERAGILEIAIPWGLLTIGDPSSRAVIDDRDGTREIEVSETSGIGLLAWAVQGPGIRADSLGPGVPGAAPIGANRIRFLGPGGTTQTIADEYVTTMTPPTSTYSWKGWDAPITEEHAKRSAGIIERAFEGMEAREDRTNRSPDSSRK